MLPIDAEHAWAAGFLDGEGNFYARQRTIPGGDTTVVGIRASQTVHDPIQRLKSLFGGSCRREGRLTVTGKEVWTWQAEGGPAVRRIVPLILPHLCVKTSEASALLDIARLIPKRGHRGFGDVHRDARIELVNNYRKD